MVFFVLQTSSWEKGVLGERIEDDSPPNTPPLPDQPNDPGQAEPDGKVTEALARVREAVTEMKDGDLRESLEAAIEAIDSAHPTPGATEGHPLGSVADALEGALDELEKGKVANLLPVIEQAQSIAQSGSSGL